MNPWTAFLLGVVLGWLIEFAIDWFFWRRKTSEEEEIEQLQTQLRNAEARIAELEGGEIYTEEVPSPAPDLDQEMEETPPSTADMAAVGAGAVVAAEVMDNSIEEDEDTFIIEEGEDAFIIEEVDGTYEGGPVPIADAEVIEEGSGEEETTVEELEETAEAELATGFAEEESPIDEPAIDEEEIVVDDLAIEETEQVIVSEAEEEAVVSEIDQSVDYQAEPTEETTDEAAVPIADEPMEEAEPQQEEILDYGVDLNPEQPEGSQDTGDLFQETDEESETVRADDIEDERSDEQ